MSQHRRPPAPHHRTRYGRVVVLGVSLATTAVALLGGAGVLPSAAGERGPDDDGRASVAAAETGNRADPTVLSEPEDREHAPAEPAGPTAEDVDETALPLDSGTGRRVVFSEGYQRVWLVDAKDRVERTYLVSGSLTDNLDPGTYEVYSRSEDAVGIDDSGTMKWFVRFTQGDTGAAIGFHDIPVDDGEKVQSKAALGTPTSHGCIRQATADAKALWAFAPLGTSVVVV